MSALHDENPELLSKVQQVRQAASTLGISERTVYRRLRSGKLEQLPTEPLPADSVMTIVSEERMEASLQDRIASKLDKMVCQNDMTNDNLAALRQELAHKDAQIRTLLENQQELTHTIQKLQEQIFELARLALLQSSRSDDSDQGPVPSLARPDSETAGGGNRLTRWLCSLWGHR
jgi:chromosome segregation ATPase